MTHHDNFDGGNAAPDTGRRGSRPTVVAALVASLVLCVTLAGCGDGDDGESTAATVGSDTIDSAGALSPIGDTAAGSSTVDSDAGVELDAAAEVIGPPLEAGSTADEIRRAVEDALGPTADLSAQVNRFVAFPPLPTPGRTELVELRADVRAAEDGATMLVSSEVTFTADGGIDELADLLSGELADLGWAPAEAINALGFPGGYRQVYVGASGDYPIDDAELSIVEAGPPSVSFPRSEVRLRITLVEPDDAAALRARFEGWAGEIPLPEGGRVAGAGIQTSSVGRDSIHFFLDLIYDEVEAGEVADQLRSGLPANDLTIRSQPTPGPGLDNWVYLDSPFFDDLWISIHERPTPAPSHTIVNIDGRVGFEHAT
ncbi:MAG: hypothetical protein ACFCVK_12430 [Acidimicrobiales bacterium]